MMRAWIAAALLAASSMQAAEILGPSTMVEWDMERQDPRVLGFRAYSDGTKVGEILGGETRQAKLVELGVPAGEHMLTLTAFSADQESVHSEPLTVHFDPSPLNAPSRVRVTITFEAAR